MAGGVDTLVVHGRPLISELVVVGAEAVVDRGSVDPSFHVDPTCRVVELDTLEKRVRCQAP